jgi:hypothetical protein
MRIIGIDPGGTTGVIALDWDGQPPKPSDLLFSEQIGYDDVALWLHGVFGTWTPDLIALERFFITPKTIQNTRQPEPLYVIGGVLFLGKIMSIPVKMQAASDAKTAYPNPRIKDWPVKGPHAKDALRHALLATHASGVYIPSQTQT